MCVKLLTNNFLLEKAIGKSKDVHLAVLRVLPEVIRESLTQSDTLTIAREKAAKALRRKARRRKNCCGQSGKTRRQWRRHRGRSMLGKPS